MIAVTVNGARTYWLCVMFLLFIRFLQDECLGCPAGRYCEEGASSPTGNCSGGFYCLQNATEPNPPNEDEKGGPCPQGFFCPVGTSNPEPCPPGRYNNLPQQEECFECQQGYGFDLNALVIMRVRLCKNLLCSGNLTNRVKSYF